MELVIVYRGRRGVYRYMGVPREEWEAFRAAGSKGTYLNVEFKAKGYRYQRLSAGDAAREIFGRERPEAALVWGETGPSDQRAAG